MKIKFFMALILCLGLLIAFPQTGLSQDEAYKVHLRKDFGYNMGSDIQGRFTIRLLGEEEKVSKVTFYIDDAVLQEDESAPFSYQFKTEQFDSGMHRLFAEVLLDDDHTVRTSTVQYNFLSRKEANQQMWTVLIGIGGAIVGSLLLVAIIQSLVIKKSGKGPHQTGMPRNYGILGGTICPKCGRPFRRHIWGMNLLIGRLERCDNCGKWVMTVRATPSALQSAEEAELEAIQEDEPIFPVQGDEKDLIEDTKYFDEI